MLRIGVIVTKLALCLQPTAAGDTIGVQRPAVSRSFSDSPFGAGRSSIAQSAAALARTIAKSLDTRSW